MRYALPFLLAAAVACGGDRQADHQTDYSIIGATPGDTIVMPPIPPRARGRLRVRAVGRSDIEREWDARADWCSRAGVLQIMGEDSTSGTILLVRTRGDDWTGVYQVVHSDSAAAPPVAHVGVLLMPSRRGFTLLGVGGTVEVRAAGRRVSGEFAMDLQEVGTTFVMKYAGSFDSRVTRRSPEQCDALGLTADSAAVWEPGVRF